MEVSMTDLKCQSKINPIANANPNFPTNKAHSLCKPCLHDLHFVKKESSSPNLSKLARADISCQFMKTKSLCRTVYTMNGF